MQPLAVLRFLTFCIESLRFFPLQKCQFLIGQPSFSLLFHSTKSPKRAEVEKMASHFYGKDNNVTENTNSNTLT